MITLPHENDVWRIDEFDPNQAGFVENPYPFYQRLRSEDPVHFVKQLNAWWLMRHSDVIRILNDPRFGKEALLKKSEADMVRAPPKMIFRDPPYHTRLRVLVNSAFTPQVAEEMRPRIKEMVEDLLDPLEKLESFDLVRDFAFPLPVMVIAKLLGVPSEDSEKFKAWSEAELLALDPTQTEQVRLDGVRSQKEQFEYFRRQIDLRRENGNKKDLISALISAGEREEDKLRPEELQSMLSLILVGGHETTTNLISGGILSLLRNPMQLELLRSEPSLINRAVEELLRYESPVQRTERVAPDNMELYGKEIRKGDTLTVVLGSANRDPDVFVNPESLDITRWENPHLAFAHGVHLCLGAPLARVEAAVAFSEVLNRFPNLGLDGTPVWKTNTKIRGIRKLPISVN